MESEVRERRARKVQCPTTFSTSRADTFFVSSRPSSARRMRHARSGRGRMKPSLPLISHPRTSSSSEHVATSCVGRPRDCRASST
eukprot:2769952-Pyramimonas_sp.AAC.1